MPPILRSTNKLRPKPKPKPYSPQIRQDGLANCHPCLGIPELLYMVFEALSPGDVYSCALTCHRWSMCAGEVLEGLKQVDFEDLVTMLKPRHSAKDPGPPIGIDSSIVPQDLWELFLTKARRVRNLKAGGKDWREQHTMIPLLELQARHSSKVIFDNIDTLINWTPIVSIGNGAPFPARSLFSIKKLHTVTMGNPKGSSSSFEVYSKFLDELLEDAKGVTHLSSAYMNVTHRIDFRKFHLFKDLSSVRLDGFVHPLTLKYLFRSTSLRYLALTKLRVALFAMGTVDDADKVESLAWMNQAKLGHSMLEELELQIEGEYWGDMDFARKLVYRRFAFPALVKATLANPLGDWKVVYATLARLAKKSKAIQEIVLRVQAKLPRKALHALTSFKQLSRVIILENSSIDFELKIRDLSKWLKETCMLEVFEWRAPEGVIEDERDGLRKLMQFVFAFYAFATNCPNLRRLVLPVNARNLRTQLHIYDQAPNPKFEEEEIKIFPELAELHLNVFGLDPGDVELMAKRICDAVPREAVVTVSVLPNFGARFGGGLTKQETQCRINKRTEMQLLKKLKGFPGGRAQGRNIVIHDSDDEGH